jgi:hypothetical protein
VDNLTAGDLSIEVSTADDALRCVWTGKSSDRQPGTFLAPYFASLLDAAASDEKHLEMHFEHLEHFNSSTITALIRLIQAARKQKVKLVMVYDHELKWQRLSFDALRVFLKSDDLFALRAS